MQVVAFTYNVRHVAYASVISTVIPIFFNLALFFKIVLAAASHVTILLTSLALAFIADAPVFAVILFLVGHAILLAVLFTRRRTHSQDDKALRLVPVRS